MVDVDVIVGMLVVKDVVDVVEDDGVTSFPHDTNTNVTKAKNNINIYLFFIVLIIKNRHFKMPISISY